MPLQISNKIQIFFLLSITFSMLRISGESCEFNFHVCLDITENKKYSSVIEEGIKIIYRDLFNIESAPSNFFILAINEEVKETEIDNNIQLETYLNSINYDGLYFINYYIL